MIERRASVAAGPWEPVETIDFAENVPFSIGL
jgi:hypothetical protein